MIGMTTSRDHAERNLMLLIQQGIDDVAGTADGLRILHHFIEQAIDGARRRVELPTGAGPR
jgi:hypothetical protein